MKRYVLNFDVADRQVPESEKGAEENARNCRGLRCKGL